MVQYLCGEGEAPTPQVLEDTLKKASADKDAAKDAQKDADRQKRNELLLCADPEYKYKYEDLVQLGDLLTAEQVENNDTIKTEEGFEPSEDDKEL